MPLSPPDPLASKSLSSALQSASELGQPLLLDGATGTELQKRGVPMDGVLWNALAADCHSETLTQIHLDYLQAGSEIVITNTFATSRFMLEHAGLEDRFEELNMKAAAATLKAREQFGQPVWVAGAISANTLSQEMPDLPTARRDFADQAALYAEAGLDLIILEMMFDVDMTAAALEGAAATGLPVWVGFSVERGADDSIISVPGQFNFALQDLLASLDTDLPQAVGIMHSLTDVTGPALDVLREYWQGPSFAYAHSGEFKIPDWQFSDIISPRDYAAEARNWVKAGISAVGSCCGLGPEHIQTLAETFRD